LQASLISKNVNVGGRMIETRRGTYMFKAALEIEYELPIKGHDPLVSSELRIDVMNMIFFTADFLIRGRNADVTWMTEMV
jgi:hypothetical protein